jgi:hypothetical protein
MKFQIILPLVVVASCLLNVFVAGALIGRYDIEQAVNHLTAGTGNSDRILVQITITVRNVDSILKQTESRMNQIIDKMGFVAAQDTRITKETFRRYDNVKTYMRAARRKIRSLADKTKTACEDLELYIDGWEKNVDSGDKKIYFKEQMTIMEDLVKDSLKILGEAEQKYDQAISEIESINKNLRDFHRELVQSLDKTSAAYKKWTNTVRASVYGSLGAASVGAAVADIFGCFGVCSAAVAAAGWSTGIVTVESAIHKINKQLKELDDLGEGVRKDIGVIKSTTGELVKVLERERAIVSDWKNDAEALDRKLDRMDLAKFNRLTLYRNSFKNAVIKLRESAEEYLRQPVNLFTLKSDKPRQKRSILTLTHEQKRVST